MCTYAPRRHAHVQALDVDRGALAVELLVEDVGEVVGQIFLELRGTRDHAGESRQLREPEHLLGRDVRERDPVDHGEQVVRADAEAGVVLRDHHLAVLRGERLREQCIDLGPYLLLIVDELVEAFGRAGRRAFEVVVFGRVAESREPLEDFFVTLREEGKRFGVELDGHGMSSYFVKIAAVAAAIPSLETLASGTRAKAS
jgi:hypothetical protein